MPQFSAFSSQWSTPTNSGAFLYQITYQSRVANVQGSMGEDTGVTWVDFQNVKASIRSLVGRELLEAAQIHPEARYKIEHHYVPGIEKGMAISWYVDGVVKMLDVVSAGDAMGDRRRIVAYAKDFER